jgi:hypothetical protein
VSSCVLASCRHPPDELQVRESIAAVARAAQAVDASGVVAPLSRDFDGNSGELDRSTLGNMIRLLRLGGETVGVTMGPVAIEHRGERMVATFVVTLTRRGRRRLPDQLGVYRVQSAWRKEDGVWHCYTASWK